LPGGADLARTAEYSIKGYIYQFLQYMVEILDATDEQIIVIEGAIEDIDVIGPDLTRAVQCKYHESVENFTLGKIYKPILLMMEHYSKNATPPVPIQYNLFCHFPGKVGAMVLTEDELGKIRQTKDKELKKIADRIQAFDAADFLALLTITFGDSFADLEVKVQDKLVANAFQRDDVKAIIYPAAFQKVADISIRGKVAERSVGRAPFLAELRLLKKATLSRWTRELSTKAEIFKKLRMDLGRSVSLNARRRYFFIDPTTIAGFEDEFPKFIKKLTDAYYSKYLHVYSPLFVLALPPDEVSAYVERLDGILIFANDGRVGATFKTERIVRDPIVKRVKNAPTVRDFHVSICSSHDLKTFANLRPDDVFVINSDSPDWDCQDTETYRLTIDSLSELEFILKLRGAL
jgi:hypothetical protein